MLLARLLTSAIQEREREGRGVQKSKESFLPTDDFVIRIYTTLT